MGIDIKPLRTLTLDSGTRAKDRSTDGRSVINGTAFHALAKQAGFFPRRRAERAASREAAEHFSALRVAAIRAEARVSIASLQTAETQIMTQLMAAATTQIGAQLVDLNARTSAVQQRLTCASSGELTAHLENRKATVNTLKSMVHDGDVAPEESAVLIELAQSDAKDDIERARRRNARTKQVVELLHDIALDGVVGLKNDAE